MRTSHVAQFAISLAAIAAAVLHALERVRIDSITIGLLGLAALPWLAHVLASAELPGGWKVEFLELKVRQELQAREVRTLRFLARSFLRCGGDKGQPPRLGRMAASRGCIIAFAHAYGSFIDCQGFRDVDVAIWTTASPGRWTDIDLPVRLSRVIGYPVDVRIVNGPPVSFLFHVLRGRVAIVRNNVSAQTDGRTSRDDRPDERLPG